MLPYLTILSRELSNFNMKLYFIPGVIVNKKIKLLVTHSVANAFYHCKHHPKATYATVDEKCILQSENDETLDKKLFFCYCVFNLS